MRQMRRALRVARRGLLACFLRGAHADRQHHEEHNPPDDKVHGDGEEECHAYASSSSTRVPQKSLGWRNSTGLPWAPILGSPGPNTRAPCDVNRSRAALMSGTS